MTALELANLIIKEAKGKWFFYNTPHIKVKAYNLWVQVLQVGHLKTDVSATTQKAFRVAFVQALDDCLKQAPPPA